MFRREDVPVSMGIIIDNSGSMRDKRLKVAAASLALVKASNPQDEVFIVNFNDDAYLDQPFTNDNKKLEEALDKIDSKGGTAMRDAISMSIDYVKDKGKKEKKVLLVVTDGNDNTSNEYAGAAGAQGAAERSADLLHRPAERRGAARGAARPSGL